MHRPLRSFYSVNEKLASSLARDLGVRIGQEKQSTVKIGLAAPVSAGYEVRTSGPPPAFDDPKVLRRLLKALRRSGQLRGRPDSTHDFWHGDHHGWYVQEALVATPVRLPVPPAASEKLRHLEALTIWICPPIQPIAPPTPTVWDASGSVVFLVEELVDVKWPALYQLSGVSSLRVLVEVIMNDHDMSLGEIHRLPATEDRFSERVELDPITKLAKLGGVAGVPRRILTTYRIAYMNDEQGYFQDDAFLRVNDILAYPLFILSD